MTLLDILSITDENNTAHVIQGGEIIATYDGKNAIPEELNNSEVTTQYAEAEALYIVIA